MDVSRRHTQMVKENPSRIDNVKALVSIQKIKNKYSQSEWWVFFKKFQTFFIFFILAFFLHKSKLLLEI